MQWSAISKLIKSARDAGVMVKLDKNFIQLVNAQGVRMYVAQPGKNGNSNRVHLTFHGYDGRVGGKEIPVAVRGHEDLGNGNVAFEYRPDDDGGKWLPELFAAFPTLEAQAKPGGRRGGRAAGPAIDVKADLGL